MPERHRSARPRIIAPAPRLPAGDERWADRLQRIEDAGFDVVAVSEHYTGGWAMEPLVTMAFAAALTTRLTVMPLVLNNDLRHPALLAKALCTADVLSGGRIALGIGAGWLAADYDALGVPFDPAGVRLSRLEESLTIVRQFFTGPEVDFHGRHYTVRKLEALPSPVHPGGPQILVGAGGPRILELAGRNADIVGVHITHTERGFDERAAQEMSLPRIARKIDRVHEAARSAGRPAPTIQLSPVVVAIDGGRGTTHRPVFSEYISSHRAEFEDSPAVLVGDAAGVADQVLRWTNELGIGLWNLGGDLDAVARVIARLATS